MDIQPAIDYILAHPGTSFIELERVYEAETGQSAEGNYAMDIAPHLCIWANVSKDFVDFVNAIKASLLAYAYPTSVLTYVIDGKMLRMPIAQRVPKNGYKADHWIPTVFYPKGEGPLNNKVKQ